MILLVVGTKPSSVGNLNCRGSTQVEVLLGVFETGIVMVCTVVDSATMVDVASNPDPDPDPGEHGTEEARAGYEMTRTRLIWMDCSSVVDWFVMVRFKGRVSPKA